MSPDLIAALCITGLLVTFLVTGLLNLDRLSKKVAAPPRAPGLKPTRIEAGRAQLRVLQARKANRSTWRDEEPPAA